MNATNWTSMKYAKLTTLMCFSAALSAPAVGQHFVGTPNFCATDLCVDAGVVVSGGVLNYPSFSFFRKNASVEARYTIKYNDFGEIFLSVNRVDSGACIDSGVSRTENNGLLRKRNACVIMPSGKRYFMTISLHGKDSIKMRDLCEQAFDGMGIWAFVSFAAANKRYLPTYEKLNIRLSCIDLLPPKLGSGSEVSR